METAPICRALPDLDCTYLQKWLSSDDIKALRNTQCSLYQPTALIGPSSIRTLTFNINNRKVIFLLYGEYHSESNTCPASIDPHVCRLPFALWLKQVLEEFKGTRFDIYVEDEWNVLQPPGKKGIKTFSWTESQGFRWLRYTFWPCYFKLKHVCEQTWPLARFHFTDIRRTIFWDIVGSLKNVIPTIKTFEDYNNYIRPKLNEAIEKSKNENLVRVTEARILKQLETLPREWSNYLESELSLIVTEIQRNTTSLSVQNMLLHSGQKLPNVLLRLSDVVNNIFVSLNFLMDIYTVARMLRQWERMPNFVIYYAGNQHTENVYKYLKIMANLSLMPTKDEHVVDLGPPPPGAAGCITSSNFGENRSCILNKF